MRLRIRLLGGVLAIVGTVLLMGGSAAWAYGPGGGSATISVSVSQSSTGITTLTVTGSGFGANETVNFVAYYPAENVGAADSDASGNISTTITLPAGYSAGSHTLSGTGSVSGNRGSASFTLAVASQALNPCPSTTGASAGSSGGIVLVSFYTAPCIGSGTPSVATPAAPKAPASGLPFTGTDAQLLAGVGAAAVCAGGLLVLSTRRRRGWGA